MIMLSSSEKILIRWLKAIGMSEDEVIGTITALDTPEKQDMLAEFLTANRDATAQEALKEVMRVLKTFTE